MPIGTTPSVLSTGVISANVPSLQIVSEKGLITGTGFTDIVKVCDSPGQKSVIGVTE